MTVTEVDRRDRRALRRFVRLERELLGGEPRFWSEIDRDVLKRLEGRSALSAEMDITCLVASDGAGGRPVARCAAVVHPGYQARHDEAVGGIGWLAAAPGAGEAAAALLAAAEERLADRGCTRVLAPFNGTGLLGVGARIAAFDEDPMFPLPWTPPHYPELLEGAGYAPCHDLLEFRLSFASERYREASGRALADVPCTIRPLDKGEWDRDMRLYTELFNAGFADEWQFHPYSVEEIRELFDPAKALVDVNQILYAELDGRAVGLCGGFPDWTPLFRRLRGRVGPLGALRLLRGARRYDRAGLFTILVLPEARGRGVSHALAATLFRYYERRGLDGAQYYLVNDVNTRSQRFAESFGGEGRTVYRVYDKAL